MCCVLLAGQVAIGVIGQGVGLGLACNVQADLAHSVGRIVAGRHWGFTRPHAVVVQSGLAGSAPCCVVAVVDLLDELFAARSFGLDVFDLRQALYRVVAVALGVADAGGLAFAVCDSCGPVSQEILAIYFVAACARIDWAGG